METPPITLIRVTSLGCEGNRHQQENHEDVRQNLFWAFAYNVALIRCGRRPVSRILGQRVPTVLTPALGELGFLTRSWRGAMAISSVSVIANSLRLNEKRT